MRLDEQRNLRNLKDDLLARLSVPAASIKKREDQLNEQHAIFVHQLHIALSLTVGFSTIYCEIYKIYHRCVTFVI